MATVKEVEELVAVVTTISTELGEAKKQTEEKFEALEKLIAEGKTGSQVDLGPLKSAIENLKAPVTAVKELEPKEVSPSPTVATTATQQVTTPVSEEEAKREAV